MLLPLLVNTLKEVLMAIIEVNGVVSDEECRKCKHFPFMCHYWQNEGESLKGLILDQDTGQCGKFRAN